MMKRYIFFLRHFNDIDNIVPVIYYWLNESESHKADIIIYGGGYDFKNDDNLNFLNNSFKDRVFIEFIGFFFPTKKRSVRPAKKAVKNMILKISGRFGINIEKMITDYREKRAKNKSIGLSENSIIHKDSPFFGQTINASTETLKNVLFRDVKPSLIIFDINRTPSLREMFKIIKTIIPINIIALPVSPIVNYNVMRASKYVNVYSEEFHELHDYEGFDKIAFTDLHYANFYRNFMHKSGLKDSLSDISIAVGSLRYSDEWLKKRDYFIIPFTDTFKKKGIKIAFFPSLPKSNVNWNEFLITCELLGLMNECNTVIKWHTRQEFDPKSYKSENVKIEPEVNSSSLIEWADIILFWSSSVAYEGYVRNKTMICLSYIVGNRNVYEDYNAGYIAKCRDDLFLILKEYIETKKIKDYNYDGVKKLISDNMGINFGQVLKKHLNYFMDSE